MSELVHVQIKFILLSWLIDHLTDILISMFSLSICPFESMFFVLLFFSSLVDLGHPFMFINEELCYVIFTDKVSILSSIAFYSYSYFLFKYPPLWNLSSSSITFFHISICVNDMSFSL